MTVHVQGLRESSEGQTVKNRSTDNDDDDARPGLHESGRICRGGTYKTG